MSVRRWIGLGVMVSLIAGLTSASFAESGRPSRATLEAMGLGSLAVISDEAATEVRGMGYKGGGSYVRVTGSSFASINGPDGGSHSENSYFAEGKHDAKGSNSSYAGVTDIWIGGGKGKRGHGNGGMGGGKPRSNGGDYGSKKSYGGQPGGGYGGGKPSVKIHTRVYFSGGSSSAWAF
jgi:hypothetical protein